jgi:ankyrin repeat protein
MVRLASEIIKKASPSLIGHVNKENNTALILSISKQFWDIANLILDTKHSNAKHLNNYGDNALLLSLAGGNLDIARKLLREPGVDIFYKGYSGVSAYDICKHNNFKL